MAINLLSPPRRRIALVAGLAFASPLFAVAGCSKAGGKISKSVGKGDEALKRGDAVQALINYNHARELDTNDPTLQRNVWRARALLIAQNSDRLTAENIEEVRAESDNLLEEDSANAATYLTALAHVHLRRGETAEAEKKLDEAVAKDARSTVALLARAAFLQKTTNKADKAIEAFNAVLAVEPNNFEALYGLGRLYVVKKDPAKEIEYLQKAVAQKADFTATEALADAYLHASKYKEAFENYLKASALNPAAVEPHWGMGMILSKANDWPKAEKELRLAMRARHEDEVEFQLGIALAKQSKCDEAMPYFLQYLRGNPKHPTTLFELGNCSAALGQRAQATGFFQQVIGLPPDPSKPELDALKKGAQASISRLGPAAPAGPAPRR